MLKVGLLPLMMFSNFKVHAVNNQQRTSNYTMAT